MLATTTLLSPDWNMSENLSDIAFLTKFFYRKIFLNLRQEA